MTTSRLIRGVATIAAGALLVGLGAGPASADKIHDGQWALLNYQAAENVWPISQGDGVTVAVIDSGVNAQHQDLTGQVVAGADFSGSSSDGRVDTLGHGTGMASLIAGHGHGDSYSSGVMGLAPKAKIMPLRVGLMNKETFSADGSADIAGALRYAVDHGAKVVNMSFGGGLAVDTREAVKYAISKDVVLVAASGNLGNHDTPVDYPAAYPGVVAVSAVDQQGHIWPKTNKGPELTLAAPGVGIYSAGNESNSDYRIADGTSDAAAYVSAIAALVRSKYPNLSAGQVINRMIKTAVLPKDVNVKLPDPAYGYGIASPQRALAPNPEIDNGSKDNPLANRPESQAEPDSTTAPAHQADSKDSSGMPGYVLVIAVVVALLVVGGIIGLVVRSRGGKGGGPGGPGAGYAPQPGPYQPVGGQQQPYPPQQQYPPQPPYGSSQPPQGNPYR